MTPELWEPQAVSFLNLDSTSERGDVEWVIEFETETSQATTPLAHSFGRCSNGSSEKPSWVWGGLCNYLETCSMYLHGLGM